MEIRRLLPYIIALLVLTFALGSLPRSQAGGSILFRSTWLLYIIYLAPVMILGATFILFALVAMHWRDISSAVGFQRARQRRVNKRTSRWSKIVFVAFWAVAIGVLFLRKGTIFNPNTITNATQTQIQNSTITPSLQLGLFIPGLSKLIDTTWFSIALLGLAILGGLILVQSYRVSIRETRDMTAKTLEQNQAEGLQAVQEAITLVKGQDSDPRARIIACYQHLMNTVASLGAPVSSNLTARELDRGIRSTFGLSGTASTDLTQLFEEARYSLHEIVESDAVRAHEYLDSIAQELHVGLGQ